MTIGILAVALASVFTEAAFNNPDNATAPGFFWMWNCELKAERLNAQLDEMAANGIKGVCIHPFPKAFRPGKFPSEMAPEYLSNEYFEVYSNVVAHAAELGMQSWLYDEGGWPSGGACGQVAAADTEGKWRHRYLGYGFDNKGDFGETVVNYGPSRDNYPSMLAKGATEKFLELTHEGYAKRIGGEFGKTVKFAFMDEPSFRMPWQLMLPWTTDFAEEFKSRKGYDITPYMPEIVKQRYECEGDLCEKRLDYMDVLSDLFIERFMLPIRDWSRAHGIISSGHFSCEDTPETANRHDYGNLLKVLRVLDAPGVDTIWRQLYPTPWWGGAGRQAPFPRYATSAAHYNGGKYVMCELMGIYGDSMTPLEKKWLTNFHLVRGNNCHVLAYYGASTAGNWMTLFEPIQGPANPMWKFEKPLYESLHRTGNFLAKGEPATEVVVYFDQRSFWAGGHVAETAARLHYAVADILDRRTTDFDFADDEVFEKATIDDCRLVCGKISYSTVVVPAWGKMSAPARSKLEAFRKAGGKVLTAAEVDQAPRTCVAAGSGAKQLRALKRTDGDTAMYFVVNESLYGTGPVTLDFAEAGEVVLADAETGRFHKVPRDGTKVEWNFAAADSAIFIVGKGVAGAPAREFRKQGGDGLKLKNGWTRRVVARYYPGERDFVIDRSSREAVPTELGDWREALGDDFSGIVAYANEFKATAGDYQLDVGRVCHICRVRVNGEELAAKYGAPYCWQVTLKEGLNRIEIEVANTLANAMAPEAVRRRLAKAFPPRSGYDTKQAVYDRDNHESGLFGPVKLYNINQKGISK